MAFAHELEERYPDRVHIHAADENAAQFDFSRFVILDRSLKPSISCSRKQLTVAASESVLEALERGGMPVLGSCRNGVCGTCEVKVIAGTPEHLDSVMADSEKDKLHVMYPCVSRALTADLVLDF